MNRNDVKIATPCTLDWKKMTPAEGGRFCGDCKKVVRNLSSMTEREARALLKSAGGGELCVRFVYDEHGRIFFGKDAPRRDALVPAALLLRARRVAAAAAIGAMPFATQACEAVTSPLGITSEHQHAATDDGPGEMMGGVALEPQPPTRPQAEDSGAGADATSDTDAGDVDPSTGVDAGADTSDPPHIY